MPTTYTRYPVETERKDPGTGGKAARRSGGPPAAAASGDDDEWNRLGRGGPRELLTRYRRMILFILAGDMMFILPVAIMFMAHQGVGHFDPRTQEYIGDWHPVQLPPILFLNTAVLILSSLTMEIARRHIFHELDVVEEWLGLGRPALRQTLPWLAAIPLHGPPQSVLENHRRPVAQQLPSQRNIRQGMLDIPGPLRRVGNRPVVARNPAALPPLHSA
jgi:cytochrome c oxidase subunit 3